MTNTKYTPPIYAEEKTLQEEQLNLQEILAQFQQLVPTNFVKLSEMSYMCSTNPKWNKPLCERYTFSHNENWLFLDIPYTILEKLELTKGQDIPYPLYVSPTILNKKELSFGALTIEDKKEIFIQK